MYAEWYDLIFILFTKYTFNKKNWEKKPRNIQQEINEKQVIFYQAYGNKIINPCSDPMR